MNTLTSGTFFFPCSFTTIKGSSPRTGFTLIELVVVIAMIAILVTLAMPSFTMLIADQRAKSAASDLYMSLTRARGEALSRNANVTISPKTGGWQAGWQVLAPTSQVIEEYPAITNATISGPDNVVYRSSGRIANLKPVIFNITVTNASMVRCVALDLSGRPYEKTPSC